MNYVSGSNHSYQHKHDRNELNMATKVTQQKRNIKKSVNRFTVHYQVLLLWFNLYL